MTEHLTTKTAASYRVTRGEHGTQVAEEAERLNAEHSILCPDGFCQETASGFRAAAERIVTLEESVRDRDKQIVELHDEITHLRGEVDGHASDATYYEAKWREVTA